LAARLTFKIILGPEIKRLRNPDLNVREALCFGLQKAWMRERERVTTCDEVLWSAYVSSSSNRRCAD
jgi:hypothetical protein